MKITISPRAEKELKKLSKLNQLAIANKIRSLVGGSIPNEEKLSGYKNIYRVRVGDYRIVFKKTASELYIVLIGHRKEIYDLLKRLF
jgi:mRNA interferase RelE/StbE